MDLKSLAANELHDVANHLLKLKISDIEACLADLPHIESLDEIKLVFEDINNIYKELGPVKAIAKDLFPQLAPVFSVLDQLSNIEDQMQALADQQKSL